MIQTCIYNIYDICPLPYNGLHSIINISCHCNPLLPCAYRKLLVTHNCKLALWYYEVVDLNPRPTISVQNYNLQELCSVHIMLKVTKTPVVLLPALPLWNLLLSIKTLNSETWVILYKSAHQMINLQASFWLLIVKLSSGECHQTLLMIDQNWLGQWLGATKQQAITSGPSHMSAIVVTRP